MIYHIYFKNQLLFKSLEKEEFDFIWEKIFLEYHKEDLTYTICIGEVLSIADIPAFWKICFADTRPSTSLK